jgi:hypothetical protein
MDEFLSAISAAYNVLHTALPSVFIGLFLANLMSVGKFSAKINRLLPLIGRVTGLPKSAVLVAILSIADRTAGMAALEAGRRQFLLDDRQVIAINLVAKAPSVAQFFMFSFIPLLFALFPRSAAISFLTSYFAAFIIISGIGLILLRLWSDSRVNNAQPVNENDNKVLLVPAVTAAFVQTLRPFIRIALWMFSMSAIVMLLVKNEVFAALNGVVQLSGGLIEANAIPLMGAGLISMVGGVAAVGAAWQQGLLAPQSIVPLLFLLSILHNLYDLFSSSLPRTIAVYGRDLGLKVGITGFIITEVVMILFFILALQGVIS